MRNHDPYRYMWLCYARPVANNAAPFVARAQRRKPKVEVGQFHTDSERNSEEEMQAAANATAAAVACAGKEDGEAALAATLEGDPLAEGDSADDRAVGAPTPLRQRRKMDPYPIFCPSN
jgi:hypothetical protein